MARPFVHLVADYGIGDPAFGEVIQRLKAHAPELDVYPTSVPKFDTWATGFWIYQYAMGKHPEGMIVYSNTAPRKDKKKARDNNAGEHLMYGKLTNGVEIIAVNAGHCFSFVKKHLSDFRVVTVVNKGSQFRSRDFYPEAVASLLTEQPMLGESLETDSIPDVPENRIIWIDGYGNIKTTIRASTVSAQAGDKIPVSINKITRTALVAGGSFSVAEGELAFAAGSSGYDDPFMELFLRGGSAEQLFEFPRIGAKVILT